MSAKPVQGAILVECDFCGSQGRRLEWRPDEGWCCPACGTSMKAAAETLAEAAE